MSWQQNNWVVVQLNLILVLAIAYFIKYILSYGFVCMSHVVDIEGEGDTDDEEDHGQAVGGAEGLHGVLHYCWYKITNKTAIC